MSFNIYLNFLLYYSNSVLETIRDIFFFLPNCNKINMFIFIKYINYHLKYLKKTYLLFELLKKYNANYFLIVFFYIKN